MLPKQNKQHTTKKLSMDGRYQIGHLWKVFCLIVYTPLINQDEKQPPQPYSTNTSVKNLSAIFNDDVTERTDEKVRTTSKAKVDRGTVKVD